MVCVRIIVLLAWW